MKFQNDGVEVEQSITSITLSKLSPHVLEYYTFFEKILIENCNANSIFINPYRFDLFAKYIYILYRERKLRTEWGETIYKEHIRAFNNFFEDDDSGKTSSYMYLHAFNSLIAPYNEEADFNPSYLIPLDENDCPLDGSHRLALSAYYKKPINIIRMKSLKPHNSYVFDYKFFINKGLKSKYSDFIALEYAKFNVNTYLLCAFPIIETSLSFESVIYEHADVYYKKDIYLTKTGQLNTVLSLYKDEAWLGDVENEFAGAKYKVDMCFNSSSKPLKIYLLVAKSPEKIIQLKSSLRNLFNLGKHSLHINDCHEQTTKLAKLFFNHQSIDHINSSSPIRLNNFLSYFTSFSKWIEANSLDKDNFCVSGSAVLSAFGLRDCYDLDFLVTDKQGTQVCNKPMISCHNEHFLKYIDKSVSIDDIVFNPENHFYIDGIKFLALDILKQFKITRSEEKDYKDIALINHFERTYSSQHDLKYPPEHHLTKNEKIVASNRSNFLDQIKILRSHVRTEWYKNVTGQARYIHPKIPVNLPEYLVDRYSFQIYLHSILHESVSAISIPDYDIFTTYNNWYDWINKNFSGLPSHNFKPPSLNSKIAKSKFRSLLFQKWNKFIKSFDIETSEGYCKDPVNIYWFEYFQNSCLFPKKPAMWGPTYFYKLNLRQQEFLIDNYGTEGVMDFFIFMQQVHEESHIHQKGEPMLSEFIHAWLWCKFIKEAELEVFQINNETSFSCNVEKQWVTRINFTKLEVKQFFQDTYIGSMSYFSNQIAYENICFTAFLFDSKQISYSKYLNTILEIFLNKDASRWHDSFHEKIVQEFSSQLRIND